MSTRPPLPALNSRPDGVGFLPPIPDGLQDWFDLCDLPEQGCAEVLNQAMSGAGPGRIIGLPAFHEGWISLDGRTDALQSRFIPGSCWTAFVVVADGETPTEDPRSIHLTGTLGERQGGPVGVLGAPVRGAGTASPDVRQVGIAGATNSAYFPFVTYPCSGTGSTPLDQAFRLFAIVVRPDLMMVSNWSDGQQGWLPAPPTSLFVPSGLPLEYGTVATNRIPGCLTAEPHLTRLAFACSYDRCLVEEEHGEVVASVRALLAGRGIRV